MELDLLDAFTGLRVGFAFLLDFSGTGMDAAIGRVNIVVE